MNKYFCNFLTILAVAVLAGGCGPGGPRLYKAVGTVTYKEKPVENAIVNFYYEDGNAASGVTDAAGKFELGYLGRPGGAAAGKCTVSVVPAAPAPSGSPAPAGKMELSKMSPEEQKKMATIANPQSAVPPPASASATLPAKYGDPKTSGLQFEVQANNNNNFPIVLKD